jgi:hypothetical protein
MSVGQPLLGKTETEKLAAEGVMAREIVKQITVDLQVTQRQLLLIIQGLSLSLDDLKLAQRLASVIHGADGLSLADRAEGGHGG